MKTNNFELQVLNSILEKLYEIESVYNKNRYNLDDNFPFVIGRTTGLTLAATIELESLINHLQNEKATN
jgi:hypothetical protein